MAYIVIPRPKADLPNASVEFACRVLARVTHRKLYSNNNSLVMKIPDQEGDYELVHEFFKYYPRFVENMSRIPDEVEAAEFIKTHGGESKIGRGFITYVLSENRVPYDILEVQTL